MSDAKGPNPNYAPYAAPASEQKRTPEALPASATSYRAQNVTVWLVCGALVAQALMQSVNGAWNLANSFGWFWAARGFWAYSIDRFLIRSHIYVFVVGLVALVLFLANANRNARAFLAAERAEAHAAMDEDEDEDEGEDEDEDVPVPRPPLLRFSPVSMGWWFFVPIFSFFRPFQAVKAVWLASAPKGAPKETQDTSLLLAWWLAWVTSWLTATLLGLNRGSAWLGNRGYGLGLVAAAGLRVIACILAVQMVRALHERQRTRAAELWPAN